MVGYVAYYRAPITKSTFLKKVFLSKNRLLRLLDFGPKKLSGIFSCS